MSKVTPAQMNQLEHTTNLTLAAGYAEKTCRYLPVFNEAKPYASGWTYHHIIMLVAGVVSIFTLFFTLGLAAVHLTNWVRPQEQRQIVRIVIYPSIFCLFNFFMCYYYDKSWILEQFPELYEVFAMVAMFYLTVLYVSPENGERAAYFHSLPRVGRYSKKVKHDRGSLRWFQVIWVLVFQIMPTRLAVSLVIWILEAVECPLKYDLSKATLALSLIQSIVTLVAVVSILNFYGRLRPELRQHKVGAKLLTFKLVIGIQLLQTPIFSAIAEYGVFDRTQYVSVFDFTVGTPAFMTCVEMFIVSMLFWWSFTPKPYKESREVRGRVMSAILQVLNISDILMGSWYMLKILVGKGGNDPRLMEKEINDVEGNVPPMSNRRNNA